MAEEQPCPLVGTRKTDFSSIYDEPSPRAYFAALSPLGYQIPQQALPILDRVLEWSAVDGAPRTVLDVCCSYGINAALLRYDISLDDLAHHYYHHHDDEAQEPLPSPDEQIAADRRFFAALPCRHPELTILGLDVAPNAVRYAAETGLLSAGGGFVENLETAEPSPHLRGALAVLRQNAHAPGFLVVCTGGVGYVGAKTFARVAAAAAATGSTNNADDGDHLRGVAAAAQGLWVVAFVLRVFAFDDVAAALAGPGHGGSSGGSGGLVTEKIPGALFRQRRFASPGEQAAAVADVRARGLDTAGLEDDGWFYAECYVCRPAAEAARHPVAELRECVVVVAARDE